MASERLSSLCPFLLLLLVSTAFSPVSSCWGDDRHNYGSMTPDPNVEAGTSVALQCTLNSKTAKIKGVNYEVNSSMIVFKFNNSLYRMSSHEMDLLNETSAQMTIKSATRQHSGYYFCFLEVPNSNLNLTLVCTSYVRVGFAPKRIAEDKFWCRSNHFYNLTCNWDPPDYYVKTEYFLHEIMYYTYVRNCPAKLNETSCQWRLDTNPAYRLQAKKFTFRLTSSNVFGNISQDFHINHYSIIKPDKPQELSFLGVTTQTVNIQWKPPVYLDFGYEKDEDNPHPKLLYQIDVRRLGASEAVRRMEVGGKLSYNITNLVPFTSYNISLRCRTTEAMGEDMWSEFLSVSTATKIDVPYYSPRIIPDSYEVIKNSEATRSITIYWEPVSGEYKNAPELRYVIDYEPTFLKRERVSRSVVDFVSEKTAVNVTSSQTFYTFKDMDSDAAYLFKIYSANDVGISQNYTKTIVDKTKNLPPKPTDVTVFYYGEGRYEISWEQPNIATEIKSYTAFWCSDIKPRPHYCRGTLHSKTVDASVKGVTLDLSDDVNYQFAISVRDKHTSSGVVWASCIVPVGVQRPVKIPEVLVGVKNSTSMRILWKLPCRALERVIEKYEVLSCKVNAAKQCMGPPATLVVEGGGSEEAIIGHLEPNSRYRVSLRAWSESVAGVESDPRYEKTSVGAPSLPPDNVRLLNQSQDSVYFNWNSLVKQTERVDFFLVSYNGKEERVINQPPRCDDETGLNISCRITLKNMRSYKLYSISVRACSNSEDEGKALCSEPSKTLAVKTDITRPGVMEKPHSEIVNRTMVYLSWKPPAEPNGPIDFYKLTVFLYSENGSDIMHSDLEIPGYLNSTYYPFDCGVETEGLDEAEIPHYFAAIQAVNVKEGEEYVGSSSERSQINVCLVTNPRPAFFVVGLAVGSALGLGAMVGVLYIAVRSIKKRIDAITKIKIELPDGLQTMTFPGISGGESEDMQMHKRRSESIPRLESHQISDCDYLSKNRHSSGASHTSSSSTEGSLLSSRNSSIHKYKRTISESMPENGHDSVSSNMTFGTQISSGVDSGIESDAINEIISRSRSDSGLEEASPLNLKGNAKPALFVVLPTIASTPIIIPDPIPDPVDDLKCDPIPIPPPDYTPDAIATPISSPTFTSMPTSNPAPIPLPVPVDNFSKHTPRSNGYVSHHAIPISSQKPGHCNAQKDVVNDVTDMTVVTTVTKPTSFVINSNGYVSLPETDTRLRSVPI